MGAVKDLVIQAGSTFSQVLRWETTPIVYKPITAITQAAPVSITSASHGIPNGWRAAVVSVNGMTQINAANSPPKDADYHAVTVIDVNTVQFNDVNSAGFKAYTSGGYLQFNTPHVLTGYTARMKIRDKVGGTVLASTDALDAPLNTLTITINSTVYTITIGMTAAATESLTWSKGVYDLEMVAPDTTVTSLISGKITVIKEITK